MAIDKDLAVSPPDHINEKLGLESMTDFEEKHEPKIGNGTGVESNAHTEEVQRTADEEVKCTTDVDDPETNENEGLPIDRGWAWVVLAGRWHRLVAFFISIFYVLYRTVL